MLLVCTVQPLGLKASTVPSLSSFHCMIKMARRTKSWPLSVSELCALALDL